MRFILQTLLAALVAYGLVTYFAPAPARAPVGDGRPVVLGQATPARVEHGEAVASYSAAARAATPSVVNVYSLRQGRRRSPFGSPGTKAMKWPSGSA